MAQAQVEKKENAKEITEELAMKEDDQSSNVGFRFNAEAPEFVPRSQSMSPTTSVPVSGYFYPCYHFLGGSHSANSSADWFFIEEQHEPTPTPPPPQASSINYWITNPNNNSNNNNNNKSLPNCSKKINAIPDDLQHKIIKQNAKDKNNNVKLAEVEYQFSDISLLANETLAKHISKDPEGYVPISVIASTKKIKSLTSSNHILAQALKSSSKLVVSDDGKKVRRKHPFTERNKEELQSRTVVAENLPEDHSHQNLEKIFRVAGRVKTVRVCHPQDSSSSRSKGDFFVSNKLHALVEFESTKVAERAIEKLNDERNWRKGLRVRLLLRCSPKSVLKIRRYEFEGVLDDDDTPKSESTEEAFHPSHADSNLESNGEENSPVAKKWWGRVRGKARGRGQSHGGRGLIAPMPQSSSTAHSEASLKHGFKGPRMPDGTRGFTMGRGKPLSS